MRDNVNKQYILVFEINIQKNEQKPITILMCVVLVYQNAFSIFDFIMRRECLQTNEQYTYESHTCMLSHVEYILNQHSTC